MARYTGATCRLCRRLGTKLLYKGDHCATKCAMDRKSNPPGQHVARRRKLSEWGTQLREKQKARYIYGVMERQFRNVFAEAERQPGVTGENLFGLLERRLDNVVFRLGLASSRAQARQLVSHGHITLNEHKADIPSMMVSAGDVVGVKESSTKKAFFPELGERIKGASVPSWLSLDMEKLTGKVLSLPRHGEAELEFDEKLVVEYYSRR